MGKFKTRAFVGLSLAFSTSAVLISGLVLYAAPHGRDAYWVDWTFWALDKDQWLAWHTILGFAFLIFSVWHIAFNLRPLRSYLSVKALPAGGWELASAFVLFVLLSAGSLKYLFPLSGVLDFGASLQSGWVPKERRAPFPHAELMKPWELAAKLGIDRSRLKSAAAASGLELDPEKDLKANAAAAGLSPAAYFDRIFVSAFVKDAGMSVTSGKKRSGRL